MKINSKNKIILAIMAVGILASVSLLINNNYLATSLYTENKINSVQTSIIPQVTTSSPIIRQIEAMTIHVQPSSAILSSGTGYNSPILHMVDLAYAIPSSSNQITLDKWIIPSSPAFAINIAVDTQNHIFFTEGFIKNKIGELVPSTNNFTEWSIPYQSTQNGPRAITADLNGNIFFTLDTNKIGRLVLSNNTLTLWDFTFMGDPNSPISIKTDSSGNVYFPISGGAIGRLVPSNNTITTWSGISSSPFSVTLDSFSNVIFTEQGGKIGKLVTSSNIITEWSIPTPSSNPSGIAVDTQNHIFFTETAVNKIGELVPSTNIFTEWILPTPNSAPYKISLDSTGIVYFSDINIPYVGRLIPSTSSFTDWNLAPGGPSATESITPSAIVVDLSDNVFVTDLNANSIGRIS